MLTFNVVGDPAAQGSKRFVGHARSGRPIMREQSDKVRPWRDSVAGAALAAIEATPGWSKLDGPVRLRIVFRFPMPASRPRAVRIQGRGWKVSSPDLSKLVRSTEDALQDAGVFTNDARVCDLRCRKVEVADGWTGARVWVEPILEAP